MRIRHAAVVLGAVLVGGGAAFGWWDTIVKKWTLPPTVATYEAEALAGVPAEAVKADALCSGGKAVEMRPGGPALAFSATLSPSTYGILLVGRSDRPEDQGDPGGLKPFFFTFKITNGVTGRTETYRMRAAYQYTYSQTYGPEEMVRCYFVAPQQGEYRIEATVGDGTTAGPILVDQVRLLDVLGNCAKKRGKTQRTMISDQQLAMLRGGTITPPEKLPREQVMARCEAYWASFPPLNAPRQESANPTYYREQNAVPKPDDLKGWTMNKLDAPWVIENKALGATWTLADYEAGRPIAGPLADDGWGITVPDLTYTWGEPTRVGGTFCVIAPLFQNRLIALRDLLVDKAKAFEKSGKAEDGLEGAAMLLAFAYNYPELDFRAQSAWPTVFLRFGFTNHVGGGIVNSGLLEGHHVRDYVRMYDRLFDYIKDNQDLADFLALKVPGVRTPDDVIRFLDINILQRTADVILRDDVAGDPLKMSRALTMAALCQGANDISQPWVDILCNEIPMGMIEPGGFEDMAFGDLGRDGLVSKGSSGYSKASIIDFLEIATSLKDYAALGGKALTDLTDGKKYPWFRDDFYAPINLRTAGGWMPLMGDYGHPLRTREVFFDTGVTQRNELKPFYQEAWRLTGDPAFAYLTYRYGRTDETPEEWAKIEADAKKTRDPLNMLPPRVLDDFGLAILETGQDTDDFTMKRAACLRYGQGHTHGHMDGLGLSVFGKGMRGISDLAAREGLPSPRLQKMHSTVEVDELSMNNGDELAAGWGWLNAFAPFEGVQYVDAGERARSHPQLREYRRGVALIDVGGADSYVFNVFRVAGGKVHTWCAHANQNDQFDVNAGLAPAKSEAAVKYLAGFKNAETPFEARYMLKDLLPVPMEGKATDALTATWRLDPRAEQAFLYKNLDDNNKVYARWQLFGRGGDAVYAADGWSNQYNYDMSFLYVQDRNAGDVGTVYPALAEVYQAAPVVQSARQLKVSDAGEGARSCVALEVKLAGGATDVCLSGPGDGKVRDVEGGVAFDGLFGFVRKDAGGVAQAVLVGGTALKVDGMSLDFPSAQLSGEVIATDPNANVCRVKGDLGKADLAGRTVLLVNPEGRSFAFTVKSAQTEADGTLNVALKERMKIFQSVVSHVDEAKRELSVVAEPYNLKADQNSYSFTEAANESLTKRWPSSIKTDTRWMVVETPVTEADIPDADGDGKRTLKIIGNASDKEGNGKTVMTLEVTRVDAKEQTIYFATPPPPFDIGGWSYVSRVIESESGKRWTATYPGIEYKVVVDGPVKMSDFDDANGDGRRVLSLYRFRPGFKMTLPNAASLSRVAPGEYKVTGITPVKVTAPQAKVQ